MAAELSISRLGWSPPDTRKQANEGGAVGLNQKQRSKRWGMHESLSDAQAICVRGWGITTTERERGRSRSANVFE